MNHRNRLGLYSRTDQCKGMSSIIFAMADKIDGMKRKLEAWKARVLREDCYDMFSNVSTIDYEDVDAESLWIIYFLLSSFL